MAIKSFNPTSNASESIPGKAKWLLSVAPVGSPHLLRTGLTPLPSPRTLSPVATSKIQLPHPADIAARKALAKEPPAPLSRVLEQASASEQWRKQHASFATTKTTEA